MKNYKVGTCSYMFLIIYGCFRISSEYFREPDIQIAFIWKRKHGNVLKCIFNIIGLIIYFKRNDEIKSQKI